MAMNDDDKRAMDILAKGQIDDSTKIGIKTKLGANDADIRAWGIATKQNDENLKSAIFDKMSKRNVSPAIADDYMAPIRGFGEGVSFGFSDNIVAGIAAGIEKVQKGGDYKSIYEQKLKEDRAELKRLQDKYPIPYYGAEIAGAIAVPVPGLGLAKGASTGLKVGRLIGETALQSAGASEADIGSKQFLGDVARGTAVGSLIGGTLGKAAGKAGELLQKGKSPATQAVKIIGATIFDLPPQYTEKLLDARTAEKVINPKSTTELTEGVSNLVKTMGDHAKTLSLKAQETLSDIPDIGIPQVSKQVDTVLKKYNIDLQAEGGMAEAKKARKAVSDFAESLVLMTGGKTDVVSEKQLGMIIRNLDNEIPWQKNEWKFKDKVLSDIRSAIDNKVLKQNNPEYREAMLPVAKMTGALKNVEKAFSMKRNGFKLEPSDATESRLKNFFDMAGEAKKPVSARAIEYGIKETKQAGNLLEDINLSQIGRRTESGQAAGSRNLLFGTLLGIMFKDPVVGMVAGLARDKYGRAIGKAIIPKIAGTTQVVDKGLNKVLTSMSPETAQRVMHLSGRIYGAESQTNNQE